MSISIKNIQATHVAIALLSALAIFQFVELKKLRNENKQSVSVAAVLTPQCSYDLGRLRGYRFVQPLLNATKECESEKYLPMKNELANEIDSFKTQGSLVSASIYLQDLKENNWINYNTSEKFSPGSLLKVPMLIAYLRMNEETPGLLDRELLYDQSVDVGKHQVYLSKSIQLGQRYTFRQLLQYTIVYSDNNAYAALCKFVNVRTYQKTFTDFG